MQPQQGSITGQSWCPSCALLGFRPLDRELPEGGRYVCMYVSARYIEYKSPACVKGIKN